jgi:CheY-like chemotaxis protein
VLIVEDNPLDAELVLMELRSAGFAPDWVRVENETEFLAALTKGPDLILSDYILPQFDGLRALQLVRGMGMSIPFIIISGSIGEETAVAAL